VSTTPITFQVQRVRTSDDVVMERHDLETTLHREYDEVRSRLERNLRPGEHVRTVASDSPYHQHPWSFPYPEDEQ
jgi:hypothetical protein